MHAEVEFIIDNLHFVYISSTCTILLDFTLKKMLKKTLNSSKSIT